MAHIFIYLFYDSKGQTEGCITHKVGRLFGVIDSQVRTLLLKQFFSHGYYLLAR